VEVVIELNPSGVIKEKGRMKKIPQFVDETAVQVTNEYHI